MSRPERRDARFGARLRVGGKFSLAVGVVLLAMLGVTVSGAIGLARLQTQINVLYRDHIVTTQATTDLALALRDVDATALQLVNTTDPGTRATLEQNLDESEIPRVEQRLSSVTELIGTDPDAPARLHAISPDFDQFLALRRAGAYDAGPGNETAEQATSAQTATLFGRMVSNAAALHGVEVDEARKAGDHSTLRLLVGGSVLALLTGLTVVFLLIRSLVPRIRNYSAFAGTIASGRNAEQLQVTGRDELTELGLALNDMVAARQQLSAHESAQTEFIETLQATASEEEAHSLVKRHLERSLPAAASPS
jgi:hypothetical protein